MSLLSVFEFDPNVVAVGDPVQLVVGLDPSTLFAVPTNIDCFLLLAPNGPEIENPAGVFTDPFVAVTPGTGKLTVDAEDFSGHITQDTITLTIH